MKEYFSVLLDFPGFFFFSFYPLNLKKTKYFLILKIKKKKKNPLKKIGNVRFKKSHHFPPSSLISVQVKNCVMRKGTLRKTLITRTKEFL